MKRRAAPRFKPKAPPVFSEKARAIIAGRYRHYKGGEYRVLGVALHSDTGRELVVYQAEYGNRDYFVRSVHVFLQRVRSAAGMVPRFERIGKK